MFSTFKYFDLSSDEAKGGETQKFKSGTKEIQGSV